MSRRPLTSAGRAHLKKRMLALPEQMRRYADESLSKSADELVDAIKAAAPKVRTGDLAASIKKEPLGEGRIGYRVVGGERGKGKKGWYIRFVEFGTKASPGEAPRQNRNFKRTRVMTKGKRAHAATRAQPFFWPTFRRSRSRIRSRTTRALKKGAKEAQ